MRSPGPLVVALALLALAPGRSPAPTAAAVAPPARPPARPFVPVGPPAPPPEYGTLHASLVLAPGEARPRPLALAAGRSARPALAGLGAVYRVHEAGSGDLARLNLAGPVASAGTPCLVVQDAAGWVVECRPAPASEAALVARVAEIRARESGR